MNPAIKKMLARYPLRSARDAEHALHEIMQEIALLGLWRGKFFEHAAFYGGTALRILYALPRFSQDLDFSLLKAQPSFTLNKYFPYVCDELAAHGFDAQIEPIPKAKASSIESAFVKANTMIHFVKISVPFKTQSNRKIQIKFEVDKDPPLGFATEAKLVLAPTTFYVKSMTGPDLFAGKLHALVFRSWDKRVKGRDWFDFVWYVSQGIPVHLAHFAQRAIQSGHWSASKEMTVENIKQMLMSKIASLNIAAAKKDVMAFVADQQALALWSSGFFKDLMQHLKFV